METHDVDVKYQELDLGAVSGFKVVTGTSSVAVSGLCPRCQGDTRVTFYVQSPERPLTKSLRFGRQKAGTVVLPKEPTTIVCDCGSAHPARPSAAEDNGCGAYWTVVV